MEEHKTQNSKKTIIGIVQKVVFHDTKSGKTILSVIREDEKKCRVIGNVDEVETDSSITAIGSWRKDEKYGWQFVADSIQTHPQATAELVDDGMIHALDFSNVLTKSQKEFRSNLMAIDYSQEIPLYDHHTAEFAKKHQDKNKSIDKSPCERREDDNEHKENIITEKVTPILDETIEVDWNDVYIYRGKINFTNKHGYVTSIYDESIDTEMYSFRAVLPKLVPRLIVHYDSNGDASLVNAKELQDAVITLSIKKDLVHLIKNGYESTEILKRIDGLSKIDLQEFIPRDKSPYINFLLENHAADKYPLVPIAEYMGGTREDGALYTLMIDGQPNIIWENNCDARSTYVFRCTEDDYIETRQLVFDYVMAEGNNKRKFLHTDKCLTIFKEKPRMVVHTTLESWTQRLMGNENVVADQDVDNNNIKR